DANRLHAGPGPGFPVDRLALSAPWRSASGGWGLYRLCIGLGHVRLDHPLLYLFGSTGPPGVLRGAHDPFLPAPGAQRISAAETALEHFLLEPLYPDSCFPGLPFCML